MKSERRHELQHNELADWLFKTGEQLKPYQNLILAGVVIVVVGVMVSWWWTRTSTQRTAQAWTELGTAMNSGSPDLLSAVADEYPNTPVGDTAAALLGDVRLSEGCNQRFASLTIAQKDLKNAAESYSKIRENSGSDSARERATYGLARVKETLGDLEAATQLYKEIVNNWPHGPFASAAKLRLQDFERPETKLMFGDLRKHEPKGEFSPEGGSLDPLGTLPSGSAPTFDLPKEPGERRAPDELSKPLPLLDGTEKAPAAPVEKSKPDADKKGADKKSGSK